MTAAGIAVDKMQVYEVRPRALLNQLNVRSWLYIRVVMQFCQELLSSPRYPPILIRPKEYLIMSSKIEIFSAGCPCCDEAITTVKAVAGPSDTVDVLDM